MAAGRVISRETTMTLSVAVQMDPIERINIRGDSTFAMLLEAQARAYSMSYYNPDQLALRDSKVSATVRPLVVRDKPGDHFTLKPNQGLFRSQYPRKTGCCQAASPSPCP